MRTIPETVTLRDIVSELSGMKMRLSMCEQKNK